MGVKRFHVDAERAGSMNDRLDSVLHRVAMRESRNAERRSGRWDRRAGWAKANAAAMSWNTAIGLYAFRNTQQDLFFVCLGDDGTIWHSLDNGATWTQPTCYESVEWDGTYRARFAPRGDDLFIALGAATGDTCNLRYDSILGVVYGVSITPPTAGPTLADGGAGNIVDGIFDYFYTFYDADTGWESNGSGVTRITLERADAPEEAATAVDGGAGAMAAGTFRYRYSFYDTVNGIESELSPVVAITQAAGRQVALSDIAICGDAGTWNRRIYRSDSGGPYLLLATLADNVTTVYADNNAAAAGAAYEYQGRQIALTGLETLPGLGRTIHRRIYRQDDGGGYDHVGTIANNTAVAWVDNNAEAAGDPWQTGGYRRIPVCTAVGVDSDGVVLWANDVENNEPATLYVTYVNHPEAIFETHVVGGHGDPIIAIQGCRQGAVIWKRRSVYWWSAQCKQPERMIEGTGLVAPGGVQAIGSQLAFLSAEGPRAVSYALEENVVFAGPEPLRFALSETWDAIVFSQLQYATSFHYPRRSLMGWCVQMCEHDAEYVANYGDHNDTTIVWHYGYRTPEAPFGVLGIYDQMVDCCCLVPTEGSEWDEPWGAFPLGYVGPLFDGQHGDGVSALYYVTIVAVDGPYVTLGSVYKWDATLGAYAEVDDVEGELGAEGWTGSFLHVWQGKGQRTCTDVAACDRPLELIVDHVLRSAGRVLQTAGELDIDSTSRAGVGGFGVIADIDNLGGEEPHSKKSWVEVDVQIRGDQT
jgi:hypothetical protein